MPSICCVSGCPESVPSEKRSAFRFHRFPHKRLRIEEWCCKLGLDTRHNWPTMRVCGRHFSPLQFIYCDTGNNLTPESIPDRNLPNIEPEVQYKHEPVETAEDILNEFLPRTRVQNKLNDEHFSAPLIQVENLERICRLCLELDEQGTHQFIFAKSDLVDSIQKSIGIEIEYNEGCPLKICQTCVDRVNYIHRSRELFHKNDQFLKTLLQELSLPKNESNVEEMRSTADLAVGEISPELVRPKTDDDVIVPDMIPERSGSDPIPAVTEVFVKQETEFIVDFPNDVLEETAPIPMALDGDASKSETSLLVPKKPVKRRPRIAKINNSNIHACSKCCREFKTEAQLFKHMNHHMSRHQINCKHCGVGYFHAGTLRMHILKHHPEEEDSSDVKTWKRHDEYNLIKEMSEAFNGAQK